MKRVLVTGATGFIGQALCELLVEQGYLVRAAIRKPLASYRPTGIEYLVVGEIGNNTKWDEALKGVDVVIHLAARVHVMHEESSDTLSKFRSVNVDGTVNLAMMAALNGVNRFIFVSSIKVNGDKTDEIPFSSFDKLQPKGPYAVSKAEAEIALHKIARKYNIDLVIVRPPLVYGPGVGGNFLHLLKIISKGVPLPLGSIKNARSMVSITNLCSFLALCIRHPGVSGKTFLISDNTSLSTPKLIKLLAYGMGCKPRIFPFPIIALNVIGRLLRKQNTIDRLVNSLTIEPNDIVGSLGWEPPQTVEDGILEVAQWYRVKSAGRSLTK